MEITNRRKAIGLTDRNLQNKAIFGCRSRFRELRWLWVRKVRQQEELAGEIELNDSASRTGPNSNACSATRPASSAKYTGHRSTRGATAPAQGEPPPTTVNGP
jgi:hypothetical protein